MRLGQAETPHAALAQLVEHRIRNVLANTPFSQKSSTYSDLDTLAVV